MVRNALPVVCDRLAWVFLGLIVGALPATTVFSQATPQPPPAEQAQAAAPTHVFTSDAGLVLNFIKPDKTKDFEAVITKLKEALTGSANPGRKGQAKGGVGGGGEGGGAQPEQGIVPGGGNRSGQRHFHAGARVHAETGIRVRAELFLIEPAAGGEVWLEAEHRGRRLQDEVAHPGLERWRLGRHIVRRERVFEFEADDEQAEAERAAADLAIRRRRVRADKSRDVGATWCRDEDQQRSGDRTGSNTAHRTPSYGIGDWGFGIRDSGFGICGCRDRDSL